MKGLAGTVIISLCVSSNLFAGLSQWSVADGGNDHWYAVVSASDLTAEEIAYATAWMGSEYAVIDNTGIGWHEASLVADRRAGGYLATIQSQAENDFIFSLVNDAKYWVGGAGPWFGGIQDVFAPGYAEPDKAWIWIHNYLAWEFEPMDYTHWYTGEPNNKGGYENVTHFCTEGTSLDPSSFWNDRTSNIPVNSFVVEYDINPVPLPGSVLLGVWAVGYAGMRLRRIRG